MKNRNLLVGALLALAALNTVAGSVPAQPGAQPIPPDAHANLEGQFDPAAVEWAKERTEKAMAILRAKPQFASVLQELTSAQTVSSPMPSYDFLGDKIARVTRDAQRPLGVIEIARRGKNGFAEGPWRLVLDVAALNEREDKQYEFLFLDLSSQCLPPAYERCLLPLSPGGSSSMEHREFNLSTGKFVADGFHVPQNRSFATWLNADTLLIAHSLPGSPALSSGYPQILRLWKRGTALAQAKEIFRAAPTDSLFMIKAVGEGAARRAILLLAKDYKTTVVKVVDQSGAVTETGLPMRLKFFGIPKQVGSGIVVQLAEAATLRGETVAAETLLAYDLAEKSEADRISVVYTPGPDAVISDYLGGIAGTKKRLALVESRNLQKTLLTATRGAQGWTVSKVLSSPPGVTMAVTAADRGSDAILLREEGFLQPARLLLIEPGAKPVEIQSDQPMIDASDYVSEIHSARSKDGTLVDYYLVRPKQAKPGPVPTIIHGYGGFGMTIEPDYFARGLGRTLISWLERGGAYVVAGIRGGGERGAAWHLAAMGRNKQRSFDDFAAVAEDLVRSGFTAPGRIGAYGRSNGGMLAAVMVTQRPDLFGAALVGVPIVDIFRMGEGDSGIGGGMKAELGDWDDPAQIPEVLRWSPYQNIRKGVEYPRVLTITSTQDNQVGPGHGRKFTAALEGVGAAALLIEGPTGGHNFPNQFLHRDAFAMQMVFFIDALMR